MVGMRDERQQCDEIGTGLSWMLRPFRPTSWRVKHRPYHSGSLQNDISSHPQKQTTWSNMDHVANGGFSYDSRRRQRKRRHGFSPDLQCGQT